jgi:pimeloyl-ACP methyl ester carboxylesterase
VLEGGRGQVLAAAFPHAQFTTISQAGHLPQLEQPDATFGAMDALTRKNPGRPAA